MVAEPTRTPEPALESILAETTLLVALIFVVILLVTTWALVWGLLKAAEFPAPTTLTLSLSILTLIAIIGALVTESTELVTLAATGLGALAGAVSSQYDSHHRRSPDNGSPDRDRTKE